MALSKAEIQEKIKEGKIQCLITFEIVGKPKAHVQETIKDLVKRLQEEEHIDVLNKHVAKAKKYDDEYFSSFAEMEMLMPDMQSLTYLCINMTPASVEIIEPVEFTFEALEIQNWFNDLLSQLHTISQELRKSLQKQQYMAISTTKILRNYVNVLLVQGPKSTQNLAKMTGVNEDTIKELMSKMEKDKEVEEKEGKWTLT